MKVLQVELEPLFHAKFKAWCAEHGTNMSRQVYHLITEHCMGEIGKVAELETVRNGKVEKVFKDNNPEAPYVGSLKVGRDEVTEPEKPKGNPLLDNIPIGGKMKGRQ